MLKKSGIILFCLIFTTLSHASLVDITQCTGSASSCLVITPAPGSTIEADPNDNKLLAWDEAQNYTLTEDLFVNRVFNETASFIQAVSGGFIIKSGTVVSSHYVQWDPAGSGRVQATINTDSDIFAFITGDQALFDSDYLGLSSLDYNDFGLRGLEGGDIINFAGSSVTIDWYASTPGDWTRMITAFSPSAVPIPAALFMFAPALLGFMGFRRRTKNLAA